MSADEPTTAQITAALMAQDWCCEECRDAAPHSGPRWNEARRVARAVLRAGDR